MGIFGPEDCEPILGTVALENTSIDVDPVLDIGANLEDGKLIAIAKLEGVAAARRFGDYNVMIHLPKGAELWAWNAYQGNLVKT